MQPFELPKAVFIEAEPWSIENGFLTPTYKFKRAQLALHYQQAIADMYSKIKQAAPPPKGL